MIKHNATHIVFSFIVSLFLFALVSTSQAAPSGSVAVSVEKGESAKQIVKKVSRVLAKKGYKLVKGDVEHINKVLQEGVEMKVASGIRQRIVCDYFMLNCRMEMY